MRADSSARAVDAYSLATRTPNKTERADACMSTHTDTGTCVPGTRTEHIVPARINTPNGRTGWAELHVRSKCRMIGGLLNHMRV